MALSHHPPRCLRGYWFPFGCSGERITLATAMHSLARYSKRTAELRRALPYCDCSVSDAFQSRLRVLFDIPSRYCFTIGLSTYLGLEVDASQIRTSYPRGTTRELRHILLHSPTGLSPSGAALSSALRICNIGLKDASHNTTSPLHYCSGFSLPYAVFCRPYSPHLVWFLFLQVLRRFSSLRSPPFRVQGEVSLRDLRFKGYVHLA